MCPRKEDITLLMEEITPTVLGKKTSFDFRCLACQL